MNSDEQIFEQPRENNQNIEVAKAEIDNSPAEEQGGNNLAAGVAGATIGGLIGGKIAGKAGAVFGAVAGAVAGGLAANKMPDDAADRLQHAAGNAAQKVQDAAESAKPGIESAAEQTKNAALNAADRIKETAESAKPGIESAAEQTKNAALNATDKVKDTAENAKGIHTQEVADSELKERIVIEPTSDVAAETRVADSSRNLPEERVTGLKVEQEQRENPM